MQTQVPRSARASLPREALIGHRYVVCDLLGMGGMGCVYRVSDTASGRELALKQLRPGSETVTGEPMLLPGQSMRPSMKHVDIDAARYEQRQELFQREYHTLAELVHPRIIEVYDYGFDRGVPYYTMELLTGSDLSALAPAPWPVVCAMMRDVASALTLLHSRRLLHRDLSPSNVHRQQDGSCKLIDFGAMGMMGKQNEIIGTPPFMPPELVRHQSIDARSDLYSLGAISYYLVTGRTVHPVRSLTELYSFVDVRPSPPSTHVTGLPRGLDALLLQLLSPDPSARPSSTIEVIERLGAIDGVQHGPRRFSKPVCISTPGLVGREPELKLVRRRLLLAARGQGASFLISGVAGSGRSRFLDACSLEGRLSGARVLRGAADSSAATPYGVITTLLCQLQASMGKAERAELALPENVLRSLLPDSTIAAEPPSPLREGADWNALGSNLLSYFSRVAAHRPVVLTIDDLERVDAPSSALIAALARRAETNNLVILASVDSELVAPTEAIRAFKANARVLRLTNLTDLDTQSLLTSMFGDADNLVPLAARVHSLSAGNPRLTMELVQHLIDAKVIRYETAGYLLPEAISSDDLPSSLGEALRARVRRLSPNAQALASTLAISMGVPLSAQESFAITELARAEAGPLALAELSEAQVAEVRGAHVTLRQAAMAEALRSVLPVPVRQALHARVAAVLAADPSRLIHAADQYFCADRASEAVDALVAVTADSQAGRTWHPGYNSLVERGIEACARFNRPAQDAFTLQNALILHAIAYNEPCDRTQLLAFCQLLCRLSGLTDWAELSPNLPAGPRLGEALQRAEARYNATPEHARTLAPRAAIQQLVAFLTKAAGFASMTFDLDLHAALPSLAPFVPLSSTIAIVDELVIGLRMLREGHVLRYLATANETLRRLAQPDGGGFATVEARVISVNLLYGVGLINASLGRSLAFEQANEMESTPSHRINALRVRRIAHLFMVDREAAESCRRQIELLQVQDDSRQFHQGGTVESEALAYTLADDLLGLRGVLRAIEEMAARHPGWRPTLLTTRAALQRVRGRFEDALALCEEALALLPPAQHGAWPLAAASQLQILLELGRVAEVRELGLAYLRLAEQHDLGVICQPIELALADAQGELGQLELAKERIERILQEALAVGLGGLHLGAIYEAAARHALRARDAERFAHHYAACKRLLKYGQTPALTARLDRLLDQARNLSISPADQADGIELSPALIVELMSQCQAEARGAQALNLLAAATGAVSGHLYKVCDEGLRLLASSSPTPAPPYLVEFLLRYLLSAEVVSDQTVDVSHHASLVDGDRTLEIVVLSTTHAEQRIVAGIAALSFSNSRRWPAPELLESIAAELRAL
jgi:tetratricopeptide (TPR) repeat protein